MNTSSHRRCATGLTTLEINRRTGIAIRIAEGVGAARTPLHLTRRASEERHPLGSGEGDAAWAVFVLSVMHIGALGACFGGRHAASCRVHVAARPDDRSAAQSGEASGRIETPAKVRCTWADVSRRVAATDEASEERTTHLQQMATARSGWAVRVCHRSWIYATRGKQ